MYNNIVDLHFAFIIALSYESANHNSFKNNSKYLMSVFSDNMDYSHRNKILLTDDIIEQVRVMHTKFKVIENEIKIQLNGLSELEDYHSNYDPQILYSNQENENEFITKRIDSIKAVPESIIFETEIKTMRDLVEKYFRTLL